MDSSDVSLSSFLSIFFDSWYMYLSIFFDSRYFFRTVDLGWCPDDETILHKLLFWPVVFFFKKSNILSEINIHSINNTLIHNNSVGTQANKNDGKRQIQWLHTTTCWDKALNPKPYFQIFLNIKKQVFLWMWLRSRDRKATHSSRKFKRKQKQSTCQQKQIQNYNSNLNKSDW